MLGCRRWDNTEASHAMSSMASIRSCESKEIFRRNCLEAYRGWPSEKTLPASFDFSRRCFVVSSSPDDLSEEPWSSTSWKATTSRTQPNDPSPRKWPKATSVKRSKKMDFFESTQCIAFATVAVPAGTFSMHSPSAWNMGMVLSLVEVWVPPSQETSESELISLLEISCKLGGFISVSFLFKE